MNRILLEASEKIQEKLYRITAPEKLEHLHKVLQVKTGEILKFTVLELGVAKGRIKEVLPESLSVEIEGISPTTFPEYQLVIGLTRPPSIKKILEHGTTLGVASFDFYKAQLSEKSFLDSKIWKNEAYLKYLHLGLAQSGCYFQTPKVKTHFTSNFQSNTEQKYFLSLNGVGGFEEENLDFSLPIQLLIGPERGHTQEEEEQFIKQGYTPIKLCPSIQRVELACFVALGQLELLLRQSKEKNYDSSH
jgi:16S rRNA (uracil1498-N3)-methyltransferase